MKVMGMNTRFSSSQRCPVTIHRAKVHAQERRPGIIYQAFSEYQLSNILQSRFSGLIVSI